MSKIDKNAYNEVDDRYLNTINNMIIDIENGCNENIYNNYLADCIVLRPFKRNTRAIKCYQKNGFDIIKEYDDFDTIGNKEKIVVIINRKDNK